VKPRNAGQTNFDPLRSQQLTLQLQASTKAAKCTGCADDAVTWRGEVVAVAHDITDGTPRARASRELGNVTVGCDPAGRNPPDHREHTLTEGSHCLPTTSTKPHGQLTSR
jgi:hypothetical protein